MIYESRLCISTADFVSNWSRFGSLSFKGLFFSLARTSSHLRPQIHKYTRPTKRELVLAMPRTRTRTRSEHAHACARTRTQAHTHTRTRTRRRKCTRTCTGTSTRTCMHMPPEAPLCYGGHCNSKTYMDSPGHPRHLGKRHFASKSLALSRCWLNNLPRSSNLSFQTLAITSASSTDPVAGLPAY